MMLSTLLLNLILNCPTTIKEEWPEIYSCYLGDLTYVYVYRIKPIKKVERCVIQAFTADSSRDVEVSTPFLCGDFFIPYKEKILAKENDFIQELRRMAGAR